MRTNHGMDLDGALANRNAGEHDYREIARSGNMAPGLAPRPVGNNGMFGDDFSLAALDQKSLLTVGLGVAIAYAAWKKWG